MNPFNPLEATKRLEAAGIARGHAEAIASEIYASRNDLAMKASKEQLDAALDRMTIRLGIVMVATVLLASSVLGVVLSN
jgi:hypothetical protein